MGVSFEIIFYLTLYFPFLFCSFFEAFSRCKLVEGVEASRLLLLASWEVVEGVEAAAVGFVGGSRGWARCCWGLCRGWCCGSWCLWKVVEGVETAAD